MTEPPVLFSKVGTKRTVTKDSFSGNFFLDLLIEVDVGSISSKQLLTGILSYYYPIDVSNHYADILFLEFQSFTDIVNASLERIVNLTGLSQDAWVLLQIVKKSAMAMLREPVQIMPFLGDTKHLVQYLKFSIGWNKIETVRVLYLDINNCLIKDEEHSSGVSNYTLFCCRKVVIRACELHASGLLIVHNHPSGNPKPSPGDIKLTYDTADLLKKMGIYLHDHLIISRNKTFSFREENYLQ